MKILFFNDFKLGVLNKNTVVDVSSLVTDIPRVDPQDVIRCVIEHWSRYKVLFEGELLKGEGLPVDSIKVRPPLPSPSNIDCMAVNYLEEGPYPATPPINAFQKSPNSVIGNGDSMILPDIPATIFEGEAELAVIIGKRGSNIAADNAFDHVFGYTNLIDGSARGLLPTGNTFYQMKSRDTFCPIGPFIVTADEVLDPDNLQVRLWNNGVMMQDFNTKDMAHKIPNCIEFVSSVHTIEPGDILTTGTNHSGLNPFMDGDNIELEIEGLGRLQVSVRDDLKRMWDRKTRLQHRLSGLEGQATPQTGGRYSKRSEGA